MPHTLDDSAGSQLALLAAVKLLLAPYRGDLDAIKGLRHELDQTRELLVSVPGTERKLLAFEVTSEALMAVLAPPARANIDAAHALHRLAYPAPP